jgi:ribonuclease HI
MANLMKPKVTIYTDGGCAPNPGTGGWAAILIDAKRGRQKQISGNASHTTSNRMELTAAIEALRALKPSCDVVMYCDSQHVIKGIKGWVKGWIKNDWLTTSKRPVANRDLWEALYVEAQRHDINWKWVKGHSGHPFNDAVDKLATEAREALAG